MLWNMAEKKVLLANLGESSMKNEERGNLTIVDDFYRVKTYTKPDDMLVPARERDFSEPYMIAQSQVGGTWNDHNAPFMVQVAGCNMKCPFCFVPGELKKADPERGKFFTASEVIAMHDEHEPRRRTIRVSGGEPFLAPEFLMELANAMPVHHRQDLFLWIDTNLAGTKYKDVIGALEDNKVHYGICGCFKGFDGATFSMNSGCPEKMWETQWKNSKDIFNNLGHHDSEYRFFFYVPELAFIPHDTRMFNYLVHFKERLQKDINVNAPLRVTILSLKDYDANDGWRDAVRSKLDERWIPVAHGETRMQWNQLLRESYPADLVWLPQYQVPMNP